MKDTILDKFTGDIYGINKSGFITLIANNYQHLFKHELSPRLTIEVFNIYSGSDIEFSAIIAAQHNNSNAANYEQLGINFLRIFPNVEIIIPHKSQREFLTNDSILRRRVHHREDE